jgi:hypothetical protein
LYGGLPQQQQRKRLPAVDISVTQGQSNIAHRVFPLIVGQKAPKYFQQLKTLIGGVGGGRMGDPVRQVPTGKTLVIGNYVKEVIKVQRPT